MGRTPKPWKYKSECWSFRYRGIQHYIRGLPLDRKGEAAARKEMARRIAEVDAGRTRELTLKEVAGLFLLDCRRREARDETARLTRDDHRKKLSVFLKVPLPDGRRCGEVPAGRFTATLLGAAVAHLESLGRSAVYISNMVGSVQAALNWAANPMPGRDPERLLGAGNPVRGFRRPRVPHSPERYAPASNLAAFLAWLDAETARAPGWTGRFERLSALMVRLMAETGCRPGEACAAVWGEVDGLGRREGFFPEKRLLVVTRWKNARKTGKQRRVVLSPGMVAALSRAREHPDRHPRWIFTHKVGVRARVRTEAERRHGDPWNSNAFSRKFKEYRRRAIRAGVDVPEAGPGRLVPYLLRHTYLSDGLRNGVATAILAELGGTSEAMIRKHYGHITDESLVELADEAARRRAGG